MKGNGLRWIADAVRSLMIGGLAGVLITIFANTVSFLGDFNHHFPYIVLLMPLGAYLTLMLFNFLGDAYKRITSTAIDFIHDGEAEDAGAVRPGHAGLKITPLMGLIAYISAAISHLVGASIGKEGAGVQIGLSASELIYRIDRRIMPRGKRGRGDYYLMCGAAAAFGSLFGSPVAGTLFGLTFASPDVLHLPVLFPSLISSYTAVLVSSLLGIHRMAIPAFEVLPVTIGNAFTVIAFACVVGLVARLFVTLLEAFKKSFGSPVIAALIPSLLAAVMLITLYFRTNDTDYTGLSLDLLYAAIDGRGVPYYAFILKATLVFLSISAGFTGGEVVPLLVTGGTMGYTIASLIGLDTAAFSVLGAIGMLAGGSNLPLACFALGLELFGYNEPMLLFIATAIAYATSGKHSIYQHQRQVFYRQFR